MKEGTRVGPYTIVEVKLMTAQDDEVVLCLIGLFGH
jgi:hypothetical protein